MRCRDPQTRENRRFLDQTSHLQDSRLQSPPPTTPVDFCLPFEENIEWKGESRVVTLVVTLSYLDPGSGGPENDFTNRNTTFMTWNLMHMARMIKVGRRMPLGLLESCISLI